MANFFFSGSLLLLSPLLLTIVLIFILLSKHIFANIVYCIALCILTLHLIASHQINEKRVYHSIIIIHSTFTFIRIGSLCIYRRTRTFHRLSLSFMINSAEIAILYIMQTPFEQRPNSNVFNTVCNYHYAVIAILTLSEFWIRSGQYKLKQTEDKILKLVIHQNKHKNQELNKYKDTDATLRIERQYAANISYLHCYTASSKQKLVIIHGYVVGKCVFSLAIRSLARFFDLYIIDAPGNGLSTCTQHFEKPF